MSQIPKQTLVLVLILALALADHVVALREMPKNNDKKEPQFLLGHDGSYLVPGIGRFMFPKKGHGYNPFTYNPVTGRNTGINTGFGGNGGAGARHSQIPGGDDTFLPSPRIGGGPPSPASP